MYLKQQHIVLKNLKMIFFLHINNKKKYLWTRHLYKYNIKLFLSIAFIICHVKYLRNAFFNFFKKDKKIVLFVFFFLVKEYDFMVVISTYLPFVLFSSYKFHNFSCLLYRTRFM